MTLQKPPAPPHMPAMTMKGMNLSTMPRRIHPRRSVSTPKASVNLGVAERIIQYCAHIDDLVAQHCHSVYLYYY